MAKQYRSEVLASIHETMEALHELVRDGQANHA